MRSWHIFSLESYLLLGDHGKQLGGRLRFPVVLHIPSRVAYYLVSFKINTPAMGELHKPCFHSSSEIQIRKIWFITPYMLMNEQNLSYNQQSINRKRLNLEFTLKSIVIF